MDKDWFQLKRGGWKISHPPMIFQDLTAKPPTEEPSAEVYDVLVCGGTLGLPQFE